MFSGLASRRDCNSFYTDGFRLHLSYGRCFLFYRFSFRRTALRAMEVWKRTHNSEYRLNPPMPESEPSVSPEKMKKAMWLVFTMAICVGFYLAFIGGWPIVIIGLTSIAAGIAYTGGPYPLGYHGFGDVFVFIFFGLIAVPGTYYLQSGNINELSLLMGAIMGMLSAAILVVNNLRDANTDALSGKVTIFERDLGLNAHKEHSTSSHLSACCLHVPSTSGS